MGQEFCGGSCLDTNTSAAHCGMCGNACNMGETCIAGDCVSGPCDGQCMNPVIFTTQSYNTGNIQTAAKCYQTTANLQGANCGNFVAPRTLAVNGELRTCNGQNFAMPAKRSGGYCLVVSAGDHPWAYFQTF
jgi:hypothetical protein